MGTTKLKPRSTILNENDNLARLRPDGNASGYSGASRFSTFNMAPSVTAEEDAGVTRHRAFGKIRWAIANVEFQQIGDKTYEVHPADGILNVPSELSVLLEDDDASVTEHRITINGKNSVGGAISDVFLYSVAGGTTVFTTNVYKEITSVVGDLTSGSIGSNDRTRIGSMIPDTVHDLMGGNGFFEPTVVNDPHNNGADDWDGYYVAAQDVADKRVFVGFPNPRDAIPGYTTSVASVAVKWWTKNIGATSNGIQLVIRINGVDYIQGTNTTTSTDDTVGIQTLVTLTINPGTGNPFTLDEINGIEVGVIFKGDSPTVEKRWNRIKFDVRMNPGFVHDTIDGSLTSNNGDAWQAVNKDPFGVGPDDEYVMARKNDGRRAWTFENLPATATTVDWVDYYLRWAQINHGAVNGTSERTRPCCLGGPLGLDIISIASRQGSGLNRDDGPLEQSNAGGNQIRTLLGSSPSDSPRFLYGGGNTSVALCGGFLSGVAEGLDIGFGIFETQLYRRLLVSGNPITAANVNIAEMGWETNDQNAESEWRFSQAFLEVQFQRDPVGAVFPHLAIDDDPDGTPAVIDADYIPSQHSSNKKFLFDFSGIPEVSEVNFVKVRIRARTTAGASRGWRAVWRVDGNDTFEAEETNVAFELKEYTRTTNPETGDKWTREEVNALQVGWESLGENDFWEKQFSVLEVEVDFVEIPEKIDAARDIGSRRLRLYRKPVPLFEASLPLQFLDPGILGKVAVTHRAVPIGVGIPGQERWERRLMRVLKEDIDLNNLRVKLTLLDLRDFLLTFWMTMKSRSRGLNFDGMAIMSAGTTVRFSRKTNAWHPDPNDGLVNELSADEPKVNGDGILVENGMINYLINSAFTEGATNVFTNWVKANDGLAGASIVESTEEGYFKSSVAPRHVLMTGATAPGDVYMENQTPDLPTGADITPSGSRYVVSVVHKDDDGEPLSFKIFRSHPSTSDQALQFPNQTWSTADFGWWTFPVRSSIYRDFIPINTFGDGLGSSGQEYLRILLSVRTAANQKNRVYHVQVEGDSLLSGFYRTYPSSPIITKTGPVVRDADELFADNTVGRLTWPKDRGTFFGIFRPAWDSAYLEQGQSRRVYVVGNVYDADNWDLVYYDIDDEELVFERKLAGVTTKATKFFPAFTQNDEVKIAARWTSAEEELGLPAFTLSIFAEGEKGTDASASGRLEPPSENSMYMGSRAGEDLSMGDGTFSEFYVTQQVLRDSEIRRLP